VAARRVALLVETSSSWGKGILTGVSRYSRGLKQPWLFFVEPRGKYEKLMLPADWQGDGVIARVTHAALAEQLIHLQLPAVNVSWYNYGGPSIARCTANEKQAGQLAAEHFLERGFRHFAYCGSPRRKHYIDRFGAAYTKVLEERGFSCTVYEPTHVDDGEHWERQLQSLGNWVVSLPRPAAILAFDDVTGRQICEACSYRNIRVPEDLAILGGESDDLFSLLSIPPLSTIDLNADAVGYRAAELLWAMMQGEPPCEETTNIAVQHVITRQSTDVSAVEDEIVRRAVCFIRENCRLPIQVADVLQETGVSRRSLEQKFRNALRRSPAGEIRRMRVEIACQLLAETRLPVAKVAGRCGLQGAETLARVFRREMGVTPTAYRSQAAGSRKA